MGISYGPKVITNGLICAFDGANTKSYTGTGSTIYDISGNGNNGTITGTISLSAGAFTFTTGGNYVTTTLNLASGEYTVIASSRWTGGSNGRIITSYSNNWLLGHWSNSSENHYAEGWVTNVSTGASDTNWRILAASGSTNTDSWQMYVNGVQTFSNSNGSAGPNRPGINCYTSEYSNGQCGVFLVYNRVLTSIEVYQVYQALRGRYSI